MLFLGLLRKGGGADTGSALQDGARLYDQLDNP